MVTFTDQIFNPNKSEVFEGSSFSAGVKFDLPFIFRKNKSTRNNKKYPVHENKSMQNLISPKLIPSDNSKAH